MEPVFLKGVWKRDMVTNSEKPMRLSIIVATMNRPYAIANLLSSVAKQTFIPQEFILVDQSTGDATKEVCDEYAARIAAKGQMFIYLRQDIPSLVRARNRGLSAATGDIICFVDDDVILYDDYFEKIAFYFLDPQVGGVSGNVVVTNEPKGFKWELRKFLMGFFLLSNYDGRMTISTFGYPIYEREITRTMRVELFGGYSMNFRRDLAMRHKSDEWFSGYSFREDVDLSYRISREAKLILVPDARFIHDVSTINRLDVYKLKRMQFKNYFYLFRKFHQYEFISWPLFFYSLFGIIVLDLLEFLLNFNKSKWDTLVANFPAIAKMGDPSGQKD
jgi:glycosyltransferase involved in cell wall biosynthesis